MDVRVPSPALIFRLPTADYAYLALDSGSCQGAIRINSVHGVLDVGGRASIGQAGREPEIAALASSADRLQQRAIAGTRATRRAAWAFDAGAAVARRARRREGGRSARAAAAGDRRGGRRARLEQTTIARVIARAGVSRPTFYAHFADRQAEACGAALRGIRRRCSRRSPSDARGRRHADAANAAIALLGFAERKPAAARMLMAEALAGGSGYSIPATKDSTRARH